MSKRYTRKERRRDDRIILFIYGLIIVAFLSVIFSAWWAVFRTTRYYSVPFPSEAAPYKCFVLDRFIQQTAQECGISTTISSCEIQG